MRNSKAAGAKSPTFIYGTAWKKEATTALVELALNLTISDFELSIEEMAFIEDMN